MRAKEYIALLVLLCSVVFVQGICADSYSTFETTKYYSANRRYLVIVTEKKRATLYRNGRKLQRVWSRTLSALPQKLFVTNDGKRVAIVDRYYGNGGFPNAPVVMVLGENGNQISIHLLGDLANLKRVVRTTSAVHWYGEAKLDPSGEILIIITDVTKRDWDECSRNTRPEEMVKCGETVPYQQLRFALSSGKLIERVNLASR